MTRTATPLVLQYQRKFKVGADWTVEIGDTLRVDLKACDGKMCAKVLEVLPAKAAKTVKHGG